MTLKRAIVAHSSGTCARLFWTGRAFSKDVAKAKLYNDDGRLTNAIRCGAIESLKNRGVIFEVRTMNEYFLKQLIYAQTKNTTNAV